MTSSKKTLARIAVLGVVQGVGFRPFIFRLATEHNLAGWVRNTSGQVDIEVEGEVSDIHCFLTDIKYQCPPMARIENVTATFHSPSGQANFVIKDSLSQEGEYQLISPDIATCRDCEAELFAPDNRRYRYPFTNCTNCGPRFTIIEDIPYDRPKTTMSHFTMCPNCQREYDDPFDRRFHAQPNACAVCGPSLTLTDGDGHIVSSDNVISAVCGLLRDGKILAIKGLGGFLLSCDATNTEAVKLLRMRKRRPSKPLAVMLSALSEVGTHCLVSPEEESLLTSYERPIVLLRWMANSAICREVSMANKYLGVMLPYTPLHHLLLQDVGVPLVMTSGNLSEEPIACDNDEALQRLRGIADYFLLHNRDIRSRYDDSVYFVGGGEQRALRRARGYAPYPIFLPFECKQVFACGVQEKNTFCFTKNNHAFVSQHIGDMENQETLEYFEDTSQLYRSLFRVNPEIVACDMHPEYLSAKHAKELVFKHAELKLVQVQHHHAHIASCLAENGAEGPVIGVAFDGTGYGPDGTVWGGEFLVADYKGFERVGHFEQVPMPGGEGSIRKPYRMALGYVLSLTKNELREGLPLLHGIDTVELKVIERQVERKINSPLTSSAGRLFDAVAALSGIRGIVDYEGQAAIELEMLAPDNMHGLGSYRFSIDRQNSIYKIRVGQLIAEVVKDTRKGTSSELISAKFHNTVAEMITEMCCLISQKTNLKNVALSGGVFQNRLLLQLAIESLTEKGFDVLTHKLVPSNDGGISLGQAAVANFSLVA